MGIGGSCFRAVRPPTRVFDLPLQSNLLSGRRLYAFEKYTFEKYTFEKYTFKKYTLDKLFLAGLTFQSSGPTSHSSAGVQSLLPSRHPVNFCCSSGLDPFKARL